MKKILLYLILSMASPFSHSGSPDGLHLLVMGEENANSYATVIKSYFDRYAPGRKGFGCDDAQLNIAAAYQKKPPMGFDPAQAAQATKKISAHKKLSRLLQSYRDNQNKNGFDGVVYYEVKEDRLKIHGISAADFSDIYLSEIPLNKTSDELTVNSAMCKAMVHLPILTPP
ncbi:hypothetical protein GCM10027277_11050 [Pseudoduganella ginsengisoli]|uniref:Uncharacterized protein n=1 Tax=Pseudoduganella ginsengisoli TaxID=1462440 RepID=A0A6L6PWD9_9BURK|nr:hypothetical protein [Pseudoduganella ginsengisoli]MTW01501.1 hypothetical protein [Pseudoduganella ginsengisoli]